MNEYTDKQFSLLLIAVERYDKWQDNIRFYKDRDKTMISMAYYLGMRKGEIAHARVCFIDRTNKTYAVSKHVAKNKKQRTIPMPDKFYKELMRYILKHKISDYLFPSRESTHPHLLPRCVGRRFEIYRKRAGLEFIRDFSKDGKRMMSLRFHDLRSTYARRLQHGGISLKVIQNLLGHAHLSSTDRYLAESTLEERKKAVADVFS